MTNQFTDPRDGNVYKTIEINGKIWLAENLRYEGVNFYYPNNDKRKAKFYGLLYKWEDAMKACPKGWHLPSKEEFKELFDEAGYTLEKQSENLRALGWGGTNTLGFRALPAGAYYVGEYYDFGSGARFWSATESKYNANRAYILFLRNGYANVDNDYYYKDYIFSVRCIKNQKDEGESNG